MKRGDHQETKRRFPLPSNGDGISSSRDRRRKTSGGEALGALVARLAVTATAAVVAAPRVLPRRPEEIVLGREHRVVQIVLEIVRRRRQVSRNLGCASHRSRHRYHWRRWAARRGLRQRLRRGQGCGARRVVPTTWSSCREEEMSEYTGARILYSLQGSKTTQTSERHPRAWSVLSDLHVVWGHFLRDRDHYLNDNCSAM